MSQTRCEWCGQLLPVREGKGRPRRFCDPKVTGRWCQKESARAGGVHRDRRYCSECGKDIPKRGRVDRKYCSADCKQEARLKRQKKERRAAKKEQS